MMPARIHPLWRRYSDTSWKDALFSQRQGSLNGWVAQWAVAEKQDGCDLTAQQVRLQQ